MVQIINKPGFGELFGTALGTGLGQGLQQGTSQGLQLLVNQRLQDLAQRNLQQRLETGLQPLFGEQSQQYSQLPNELLSPLIKELSKAKQNVSQAAPGLRTLIPELSDEDAAKVASLTPGLQLEFYRDYRQNPEALQAMLKTVKPSPLLQAQQPQLMPKSLTPEQKLDQQINKLASRGDGEQRSTDITINKSQKTPEQQVGQPEPLKLENAKVSNSVDKTFFNRAREVLNVVKEPREELPEGASFAERAKRARDIKEEQKEVKKAEAQAQKEGMKFYHDINKAAKGAKEDLIRLDEIMELNEKGNLGFPVLNTIIKSVGKGIFGHGVDLSFLMTRDAQKLDKLSNDFVKNAKEYFGSRLTDQDLKVYLTTLPTLFQSKEGRREVIRNMRIFLDAKALRQKAANQILKANNNKFPENYEGLIEEIAGPELNNLAAEYKASPSLQAAQPGIAERILQGVGLAY
jgi:hypothetical protein